MTVTLTDTTVCDCEKDGHNELIYIKNDKDWDSGKDCGCDCESEKHRDWQGQ